MIERRLLIELSDDGCGVIDSPESPSGKGYGIGKHSALRRAKKLDGTLKRIDLKPSGTKLQLSIPLLLLKNKQVT
jgi:signal transduction histidine kinase